MRKRKTFSTALELSAGTTKGDIFFTRVLDLPIAPVSGMRIDLEDLTVRVEEISLIWNRDHEVYKKGTILCGCLDDLNDTEWDESYLVDMAKSLPKWGWFISEQTEDSVFEFLSTLDLAAKMSRWALLRAK